ncbi:4'-phosphopantetheinyl transferase superfamily protein [Neisseriaceae bacterium PsAf]|nr:4'-phosphopantetheinyl transferase superfamily protein [Neisseriaceae bacterium PsAf]
MTEVWIVELDKIEIDAERFIHIFSEDEKKRYHSFVREVDATLYLKSHLLMKAILARKISQSIHNLNSYFYVNQYNKPYLLGGPFFSISHTKGLFTIAISELDVGIDVENTSRNILNFQDFDFIWSKAEKKFISTISSNEKDLGLLWHIWVRKESVVKALGYGLYQPLEHVVVPLKKLSCSVYQGKERFLYREKNHLVKIISGFKLDLPLGYVGFVASKGIGKVRQHMINKEYQLADIYHLLGAV